MPTASASEKCFSRLEVFAMMRSTSSSPRRGRAAVDDGRLQAVAVAHGLEDLGQDAHGVGLGEVLLAAGSLRDDAVDELVAAARPRSRSRR